MYVRWPNLALQVDLLVYRFGALRVLAGQDPYSIGLTGNPHTLLFDYTPFAALCSLPLTLVTPVLVPVVGFAVNAALIVYAVRRMLVRLGTAATVTAWSLGALLVGSLRGWSRCDCLYNWGRSTCSSSPSWSPICSAPTSASGRVSASASLRASS